MDKKPQEQEPQRRQPTVLPQPHHPERRPTVDPIVAGSMRPEPGAENIPSDVLGSYTGLAFHLPPLTRPRTIFPQNV